MFVNIRLIALTLQLEFVVVDDKNPDEHSFIGVASVKMAPLLHGNVIEDSFSLQVFFCTFCS